MYGGLQNCRLTFESPFNEGDSVRRAPHLENSHIGIVTGCRHVHEIVLVARLLPLFGITMKFVATAGKLHSLECLVKDLTVLVF